MEKIALIMNSGSRKMVINEKSIKRLERIGEVVFGNGNTDRESVKKALAGATIAITSWGNEPFDEDILSV
ncbi:MAG TPA: hypothetical protein DD733_06435, partial [Clostridiales bacterium]|nr:hypothetical protein [Clostridiales bacterium]